MQETEESHESLEKSKELFEQKVSKENSKQII